MIIDLPDKMEAIEELTKTIIYYFYVCKRYIYK